MKRLRFLSLFIVLAVAGVLASPTTECPDDRGDQFCIVTKCGGVVVSEECSRGFTF